MPFCPDCRYEYRVGVTTCADCGSELVDKLDPNVHHGKPDLVAVGTVMSSSQAELGRGALENEGINAVVVSTSFTAYGKWLDFVASLNLTNSEGNVVLVDPSKTEEARLILAGVLGDEFVAFDDTQIT